MQLLELITHQTDSLKMVSILPCPINSQYRQYSMKPMITLWLHLNIWWAVLCTQLQLRISKHSYLQITVIMIRLLQILVEFAIIILLRLFMDNLFQIAHPQLLSQLQQSQVKSIKLYLLLKYKEAKVNHKTYDWKLISIVVWVERCSTGLIVVVATSQQVEETMGTTEISNWTYRK